MLLRRNAPAGLIALLVLACGAAHGADRRSAATGVTLGGVIEPRQQTSLIVAGETAKITLSADGIHYRVESTIQLSNSGPAQTVKFGLPVMTMRPGPGSPAVGAEAKIAVNGRPAACQYSPLPKPIELAPFSGRGYSHQPRLLGYCVATATVADKSGVALTANFRGEMWYENWVSTKSTFPDLRTRVLSYSLHPRGYATAPPTPVKITVYPGPFADEPLPTGAVRGGSGEWIFNISLADRERLGALKVPLEPRFLRARQATKWLAGGARGAIVRLKARAGRAETGHPAALAIDGRINTAWCAKGAAGSGSEWLELRALADHPSLRRKKGPACRVEGLILAAGDQANEAAYKDAGVPTKVRLSPCGDQTISQDLALRHRRVPLGEGAEFHRLSVNSVFTKNFLLKKGSCMKVEILDALPGPKRRDSCLSEVAAIVNCGG